MAECVIVSKPMNLYNVTGIHASASVTSIIHIKYFEITAAYVMLYKTSIQAIDVSVELLNICVAITLIGLLHAYLF